MTTSPPSSSAPRARPPSTTISLTGASSRISAPNERAAEAIAALGYEPDQYPDYNKDYFDTLQAFWLLSQSEGLSFRELPGFEDSVIHIGGTSYLHRSDIELAHRDAAEPPAETEIHD